MTTKLALQPWIDDEDERLSEEVSRAEFAYRTLLEAISNGELRPGQRMRENELAKMLNISRTPIREAMRRLSSEGLVVVAPSRGMMVAQLDKLQVRELYSIRATLEGAAARLAAQHASAGEIAVMKEILDSCEAENEPLSYARLNRLFHQSIHESAHNRYLTKSLSQLATHLALLPGTTFEAPGRSVEASREHRVILDAIERRDPDAAEAAARQHIEKAGLTRMRMMFSAP
ncbi:GntR family transcriptional regulator [Mesorhizobium sp. J18]|uniref:GntR family transcriptional regulator n=1 Tax=Mesorhizobium sp. J18 TaxID=935263 RepID=UPI001FEDA4B2|nr:GntR family transcriptional regulator [Mesorhizobium sp. J18]